LPAAPERPIGVQFDQVEKRYGAVYALRNLTLGIAAGECVAIAGRNGSGKTTLLRVAAQLVRPGTGTVAYSGASEVRRPKIGFVGHATMVYDELTAEENLRFFARLLGVRNPGKHVGELLREVALEDRKDSLVRRPPCCFLTNPEPAWIRSRARGLPSNCAGCAIRAARS